VSVAEVLSRLEETTRELSASDLEDPAAIAEIVVRRGAAVDGLRTSLPPADETSVERLREALRAGDVALDRLRLKRAATRVALARAHGESYRLRCLQQVFHGSGGGDEAW
jgi:hypothetical protein